MFILQECKKIDRIVKELQFDKIELESKLTCLNDKIIHVQKDINELNKSIEDVSATKLKVVSCIYL